MMEDNKLLSNIVRKLKHQPFLFIIAVILLLIGLALNSSRLATWELRFIIIAVIGLTVLTIVGYYILSALKIRPKTSVSNRAKQSEASDAARKSNGIYHVSADQSVIGAIGPDANVTQYTVPPQIPAPNSNADMKDLEYHRQKLKRLLKMKSLYAQGTEPSDLRKDIEAEQQAVRRLESTLSSSKVTAGDTSGKKKE